MVMVVLVVMVVITTTTSACKQIGEGCSAVDECCPGNSQCETITSPFGDRTLCKQCGGAGDTCGALHSCCQGLVCDGILSFFNGKCI